MHPGEELQSLRAAARWALRLGLAAVVALTIAGCRRAGVIAPGAGPAPASLETALAMLEKRDPWQAPPAINLARHPAEVFLKNWVIVLDPGHGGDGDRVGYKRGPGNEREAEMNWRVAVLLEKLLEDAGVQVLLTRRGDEEVTLAQRADIANTAVRPDGSRGADLFLSLHHNATGDNDRANYTSVWYHAQADGSETSLDVARYLTHPIARALRTEVAYTAPLMSDQIIYQGGFGVLRDLQVPGVLIESSFYSNPHEEQRLRDAVYNLREAYAIYQGLCEYAYGGRPTQSLPRAVMRGDHVQLLTTLDDGLPDQWPDSGRNRILTSTISARIGDKALPLQFDPATGELVIEGPALQAMAEPVIVSIHHTNLFKHHNWPQRYRMTVAPNDDGPQITVEPLGPIHAVRVPD